MLQLQRFDADTQIKATPLCLQNFYSVCFVTFNVSGHKIELITSQKSIYYKSIGYGLHQKVMNGL
jgi:hypothetical protein